MFRNHILKKNIRNLYSINTDVHISDSITTNTLNGFTFPTEDGASSQVLSTNGDNVLSFIDVDTDLVNDTSPQLGGDLDLNNNDIIGTGVWNATAIADNKIASSSTWNNHVNNSNNPHSVDKSDVGLSNVENTTLSTWAGTNNITTLGTIVTGVWNATAIADNKIASSSTWNNHVNNSNNPHSVDKSDVGLSNVENTTLSTWAGTNNITTLGTIVTGVWNATAIADNKIASSSTWNNHVNNVSNPHSITKEQLGLGNVENVTLSSWSGSSNLNTLGTINTLVVDNACSVGGLTTKANIGHINDPGLLTLSSGFLNVDGDVVIDGNLTIHGTETTINSTTITINDVFIELAEENNGDATDFGIVGQYNSSGVKYAGLFRDHSDKRFKFVKDLTTLPVSNISSYTKANLEVDNLYGDVTGDITGNLTGNVTGNVSGTAASVTTAAQTAITSVGTLTSLNVSGNVGIGDTTPSYKLDVNGTGRFTGDLTSNGFTCSRLTTSVTGTFGSVQTRGTGEGLYDGYSIDGNFVFMAYNADNLFIHNDVDNQHIWRYHRTGQKHSFYVAGGEKMTIDSNGNVGIGQSINLQHKLYVNGTSKFMDDLTCNAGFSCSGLTNTITGSRGSVETKEIYNRWAGYSIDGNFVFTAWDANNLYIYNDVDNQNIWRYDRTNSRHSFYNAGSTKMTIDSNGNVGIGDSTPSYKLDVAGDINLTGSLRINGTAQTFGGGSSIWSESSSEAYYAGNVGIGNTNPAYKLDVSGTGRFTGNLTCSGYVGIGTNNPDKKLHILGSSNEIAHFERDDGNAATIKFSNTASSEGAIIGLSSTEHLELANLKTNKDIIFKTNNTEIIRVDNGGNVGIGTNSPTYKLDVNGTGRFTGNLTCNNFTGANAGITMSGYIGRSTTQTGFLCGINSSSHTSPIYCLSTGHTPNETTLSNMYGIGYCSGSASFITGTGSGLGMYVAADGDARVFLGANSSSVSYINTTGNFGLGTDSPSYKLDVAGTGRFTGDLTCDSDFITNKLLLEGGTSQYPYIEAKGAGNPKGIGFFTENTEKMRIHKNGNVGIGTTNPAEKLHVDGNVKIENGYYTGTEAGIHLKTIVLTHDDLSGELDLPVPSNFNKPSLTTNTWYNLVYFEYTPVSTSSYLIIESNLVYEISGYGTDKFESRIDVNSVITLHTNKQNFNNNKGGGGRSGCLFPIKARYTNTNDNNKVIEFFFRRTSGDDEIEFDVNNIFVQVTEITR